MHRFFIPPDWIQDQHVNFGGETAHQIRSVLRMRPGDQVTVLVGDGQERTVRLEQVSAPAVNGSVTESRASEGEPAISITLYQCLTQREKFEWILQKSTELGVAAVTPVVSSRSLVRKIDERDERKIQRWERILQEAAEQSRRGKVPRLHPTLSLDDALRQAIQSHELCLIPWEEESSQTLRQALQGKEAPRPVSIAVFIGPEGGFSPEEIQQACQAGAHPVSLGPRILRVETAAITSLALILYELGEMG